jgi:hypothetical protein
MIMYGESINHNGRRKKMDIENNEMGYINCRNCGTNCAPEESACVDGEYYCEDCLDELYPVCDRCGERVKQDYISTVIDDYGRENGWCSYCVDNYAYACEDCGTLTTDPVRTTHSGYICRRCYENNYFTCQCCGEVLHTDYYGGDACCENCFEDDEDDGDDCHNDYIHDYHHRNRITLEFHTGNKETRNKRTLYAGIELEVEGDRIHAEGLVQDFSNGESDFWLEHDSSLSHGFEMVYHPRTLKSWQEYTSLGDMLKYLRGNGFQSHNTTTCGLHVHISRKPLTKADEVKLGLFCGMNQAVLSRFGRRDYNSYCNPKQIREKKNCNHNESGGRYEAINYQNDNTIEFRFFKGSLKADTVLATVEFCFALVAFVKVNSMAVFNGPCWQEFVAFVDNEKKHYSKLHAYIDCRHIREFNQ